MHTELLHENGTPPQGRSASALRSLSPVLATCVDDFYLSLKYPAAFDFQAMPLGWQKTQRILAAEHEKLTVNLQARIFAELLRQRVQ